MKRGLRSHLCFCLLAFTIGALLVLIGCGTRTVTGTVIINNNPVPAITTLSPSSSVSGGQALLLTVNGAGFVSGAVVRWNGADRPTTFVSSTQLTASISASDVATAATVNITVFNPAPGGGVSAVATFNVANPNPVPVLSSLSPSKVGVGTSVFTLTVNGSGVVSGSVVRWNGADRATNFVSSTQLTATIFASDVASAATVNVTVFNPAPMGGTSTAATLAVVLVPQILSLSPGSVSWGASGFSLQVNGSNFTTTTTVRWNGSDRPTSFVSASMLQASISAADVSVTGTATVSVFDSTAGMASNTATFNIMNVVSVTLTPDAVSLDQGATQQYTATVFGSNDHSVTWSVTEGSGAGTVSATGTYTAPAKEGTYHVVATSVADPTKNASVAVHVNSIWISVTPYGVAILPGGTVQFTANVYGTVLNTAVTWTVPAGSQGTISSTGLYTASTTVGGPLTVSAAAQADATKTATAQIWVDSVRFHTAAPMTAVRRFHSATLLANGDVFIAGGAPATTEVYDHTQQTFRQLGTMMEARSGHTATLLNDGTVLIVGGGVPTDPACWLCGGVSRKTTEVHNPTTGAAASAASMALPRAFHTATLLPDGRVLVAGGIDIATGNIRTTIEIYDPTTKQFTVAGTMSIGRYLHTATLTTDGKVVLAGGERSAGQRFTTDIFDPKTGTISTFGIFPKSRNGHTATLLPDGSVLMGGGGAFDWALYTQSRIFTPSTGRTSYDLGMFTPRMIHTATLVNSGTVLLAGGFSGMGTDIGNGTATSSAELFDVAGLFFRPALGMTIARAGHAATLLQNGTVLITGGSGDNSAEIYAP